MSLALAPASGAAVSVTMSNVGSNLRATYAWSAPDAPTSTPALVLTYVSGGLATPGVSWTLGLGLATESTSSGAITFNPASAANFLCTGICVRTVTPPSGYTGVLPEGTYSAVLTYSRTGGQSTSSPSTVRWDLTTLAPTLTSPTSSSTAPASGLVVSYALPEVPTSGSVSLAFAGTGLCSASTVTLTMVDSPSVSTTISPAAPAGSSGVSGVTGAFTASCSYNVTLSYRDDLNNPAASVVRTAVVIPDAPGAPTGVSGVSGAGDATVSWTAPPAFGSAITSYAVTASPGGATCAATAPATTCVVPGLNVGSTYTFTVAATNGVATGGTSSPSAGVLIAGLPAAPTAVGATAGVRQATVAWTAGSANGSAITGYVVTASPGGASCGAAAPSTSCVVSGLDAGGTYTFSVVAANGVGSSAGSSPSAAVVLPDVPGVPTDVAATPGVRQAAVAWTAPADNGSAISGYVVTASPGGASCAASAPSVSCTVTGLTAGQAYVFTVGASNAVGVSASSAASPAVTALDDPAPPGPSEDAQPPLVDQPPDPGTPDLVVDGPIPVVPTAVPPATPKPVKLTLRVGNSVTASAVARFVGLARPRGSQLRVAMTGRSTKYCRVTRSKSVWRVHGVRAGTCKLTLTLKPKTGPVVKRKITVPVLKKKRR